MPQVSPLKYYLRTLACNRPMDLYQGELPFPILSLSLLLSGLWLYQSLQQSEGPETIDSAWQPPVPQNPSSLLPFSGGEVFKWINKERIRETSRLSSELRAFVSMRSTTRSQGLSDCGLLSAAFAAPVASSSALFV